LGEARHAFGAVVNSADPSSFFLSSEAHGLLHRYSALNGDLLSSSPVLGSHATAVTSTSSTMQMGQCEPNAAGSEIRCTLAADGIPMLTFEAIGSKRAIPCEADHHCQMQVPHLVAAIEQSGFQNTLFRSSAAMFGWGAYFKDDKGFHPFSNGGNIPLQKNPYCTKPANLGAVEVCALLNFEGYEGPLMGEYMEDSLQSCK